MPRRRKELCKNCARRSLPFIANDFSWLHHLKWSYTLLAKKVITPPLKTIKPMWIELLCFHLAEIGMIWTLECSPTKSDTTLGRHSMQGQVGSSSHSRNHSIGGRSPKSIFTLWQLWINICIFFQKFFLIVRTMPRPTPMDIRHEVFALAHEGNKPGAIAARVGLTRATVNRILKRHAATGSLVPGKSSGAPRKTTPRQDRALLRMVRQDRFLSARALTARMRNLYGMRAGRTTVNNRLLSRGYRAYRPTTKPCWLPTTVVSTWSGRRGGGTWQWPADSMSSSVMSRDSNFTR